MGELASTLVSLSGPDSVHGIIPKALVSHERDDNYTSTQETPATPGQEHTPVFATNGVNGTHTAPTPAVAPATKQLAVPSEAQFGKTTVVKDMHSRKQMMAMEVINGGPGSGFIALPGGYGTIEELVEMCTWNQLGIHAKGVCVLNVNGFWDGLLGWVRNSIDAGFIRQGNGEILKEAMTAEDAIRQLREYKVSPNVLQLKWSDMK
jgi:uncharacterized protein (TIGR00730 family)